jgi:hypothetical protein
MKGSEEIVTKSDVRQYFVNDVEDSDGYHIIHREGCEKMPPKRTRIGQHHTCEPAIRKADGMGYNPKGCVVCSTECRSDT